MTPLGRWGLQRPGQVVACSNWECVLFSDSLLAGQTLITLDG